MRSFSLSAPTTSRCGPRCPSPPTEAAGAAHGARQGRGPAPDGALVRAGRARRIARACSGACTLAPQRRQSRRKQGRVPAQGSSPTPDSPPRLLANLYNGNVYLWNYNDSVRASRRSQAQRQRACCSHGMPAGTTRRSVRRSRRKHSSSWKKQLVEQLTKQQAARQGAAGAHARSRRRSSNRRWRRGRDTHQVASSVAGLIRVFAAAPSSNTRNQCHADTYAPLPLPRPWSSHLRSQTCLVRAPQISFVYPISRSSSNRQHWCLQRATLRRAGSWPQQRNQQNLRLQKRSCGCKSAAPNRRSSSCLPAPAAQHTPPPSRSPHGQVCASQAVDCGGC